jgi:tetratricopeptide (TPR) repeat protein
MSINTATNRLMLSSYQAAFYQELLSSKRSFEALGNRLIGYAERAHRLRQLERLREISEVLSNLPIEEYRYLGQYYLALSIHRNGKGNIEYARQTLERIVDHVPSRYRSRAILALAAISARKHDYDSELYYYDETIKAGGLDIASLEALRGIAILKAKEGYHNLSVKDLEKMYPLMRHAPPHIYFGYLNSLAVELGEIGRKNEARNIIRHVLASPYAFAYPEWQQTGEDLRPVGRSFVVPYPSPVRMGKLLSMPPVEQTEPIKQDTPAPIVSLEQWKKKMGKEKNGEKKEERPKNRADKLIKIYGSINEGTTDEELDKILDFLEKLKTKKP